MSAAAYGGTDSFEPEEVFRRVADRVTPTLALDALDRSVIPPFGDHTLNPAEVSDDTLQAARDAAVLIGLVVRGDSLHVLLTERTADLRTHAGQIAFPGGKIDPDDATPAATALREAWEEVGLPAERVRVFGYLGGYLARTGYRIIPVVARIDPPFTLQLNPAEVVATFEVPFAHLMTASNHLLRTRELMGRRRYIYAIEHGERTIWGVTAGILRVLYERLYG